LKGESVLASEKVLERKKQQVAEVAELFSGACSGVIVDYKGISVEDDTKMRKELREADVKYEVVKNSILVRAAEKAGISGLDDVFKGTTAIGFAQDEVSAARVLSDYASKIDSFTVKGGFLNGEVVDLAMVDSLAKLPPRDVLLATVCNAFQAPIAALARAIKAVAEKGDEAVSEEEAPVEE
jgi:large subunit ribosomal protein L10